MLLVAMTIFNFRLLLLGLLLLDRVREQLFTNLWKELLEAQIETAPQCVIADDAVIGGGEDHATAIAARLKAVLGDFLLAQEVHLVKDQSCFVLYLGCGGAIFIEVGCLNFFFHDGFVFSLTLWDQSFQKIDIILSATNHQLLLK